MRTSQIFMCRDNVFLNSLVGFYYVSPQGCDFAILFTKAFNKNINSHYFLSGVSFS